MRETTTSNTSANRDDLREGLPIAIAYSEGTILLNQVIDNSTAWVITDRLRQLGISQLTLMELIGELAAAGIRRYHADFTRHEMTFYSKQGPSLALGTDEPFVEVSNQFLPDQLEDAFQEAWRNEQAFGKLPETAMKAGCSGYFLQLAPLRILAYGLEADWKMIDVIGIDF